MDKLRITYEDPKTLTLDPKNARLHPEPNQKAINYSLSEFDFRKVAICVWEKNQTVYAGNALVTEAIRRGYAEVPVAWIPADWTETKVKAFGVADNQIALLGEWDLPNLNETLEEIKLDFNLDDLGFSETDLDTLFADQRKLEATDDDFDTTPETEAVSQPGDLWMLGRHRVLCGDCTVRENVERVMGGEKTDLCVTDPPYGVNYDPQWRNKLSPVHGIRIIGDDNFEWLRAFDALPCDVLYMWMGSTSLARVQDYLESCGFSVCYLLIWNKDNFALGRGDYHWKHEFCLYMVRRGAKHNWQGARDQATVWDISTISSFANKDELDLQGHGNQKPIECMARPIRNNSVIGQLILDPFIGSGTTLIAAHQLDRVCYGLEIEPRYVDVVVRRFVSFVGSAEGVWCERDGEKIAYQELFRD